MLVARNKVQVHRAASHVNGKRTFLAMNQISLSLLTLRAGKADNCFRLTLGEIQHHTKLEKTLKDMTAVSHTRAVRDMAFPNIGIAVSSTYDTSCKGILPDSIIGISKMMTNARCLDYKRANPNPTTIVEILLKAMAMKNTAFSILSHYRVVAVLSSVALILSYRPGSCLIRALKISSLYLIFCLSATVTQQAEPIMVRKKQANPAKIESFV